MVVKLLLASVMITMIVAVKPALSQTSGACPKTEKGIISSSTGVPGLKDHSDAGNVSKGNHLLCKALASPKSSVPAACYVVFSSGGAYTIGNREDIVSDYFGTMTLSCNGTAPACCGVQIVPTK